MALTLNVLNLELLGGILFGIATDAPGFTEDEAVAELGSKLRLPPALGAGGAAGILLAVALVMWRAAKEHSGYFRLVPYPIADGESAPTAQTQFCPLADR